jgi:hypothetical protein
VGGADCSVERHPDHLGGAVQQRRLATEQPQRPPDPEGAGTGPGHLHPRGHVLEGGDHRFEASGLRRLVALEDGWAERQLQICVAELDALPRFARDLVDLLVADARDQPD